jgi:hypothetical protein
VLIYWINKHQPGELAEDGHLEYQVHEYDAQVVALERKIGQLTIGARRAKKRVGCYPSDAKRAIASIRFSRQLGWIISLRSISNVVWVRQIAPPIHREPL